MSGEAGLRVLVVEDEVMVSMLIEDMLVDLGHTVVGPAARLEAALALAQGEAIDLAILDLNLNGTNTGPVAAALRARGVPFLFATGYGAGGVPAPFEKTTTLQKPFVFDALRAAIERLVPPA